MIIGHSAVFLVRILLLFDKRVVTVGELFAYIFGIYLKFGKKDLSILAPFDSVSVAT